MGSFKAFQKADFKGGQPSYDVNGFSCGYILSMAMRCHLSLVVITMLQESPKGATINAT
jgi:hypothetical protein